MSLRLKTICISLWLLLSLMAYGYYGAVIANYNATDYMYKTDYSLFYQSTQFYYIGKNIYSPNFYLIKKNNQTYQIPRPNSNFNPPVLTLLILWLGKFKFVTSLVIWLGLSLIAGMSAVYLLQRAHGVRQLTAPTTLALMAAFLCYFPTFLNYRTGQLGLFLLFGVTLLWLCSRRRQDVRAGIVLGILVSIKLFTGLFFLFFIIQRRWRLLGWSLLTIFIGSCIGLLLFGWSAYSGFYHALHQAVWFVPNWNAAVYGYLFRLVGVIGKGRPIIELVHWVMFIYYMVSILIVGILIWYAWPKPQNVSHHFDLSFAFTLATCLFLSPLGWSYYFPALLAAVYIILKQAAWTRYVNMIYLLTGISLLLSAFPVKLIRHPESLSHVNNLFWSSSNFYALALLLLILILERLTLSENKTSVTTDLYVAKLRKYTYSILFFLALFPSGLFGACFAHMVYG